MLVASTPERENEEQRGAMAGSGTAGVACYPFSREDLKAGDKEIAKERNREREIEKDKESCRVPARGIIHFTHAHPLNEVCWSPNDVCNICGTLGLGWGYRCESCNFNLHKECAQMKAPATLSFPISSEMAAEANVVRTFVHRDHPVSEMYSNSDYPCTHCKTHGYGRRYRCVHCDLDIHPVCAENPTRLSTFMHPRHELELKTKPHMRRCDLCGDHTLLTSYRVYKCKECKFYVHPACSQLPQYLSHQLHQLDRHVLVLRLMSDSSPCDAPKCKDHCKRWRYHCGLCNISIHIECVLRNSIQGRSNRTQIKDMIQVLRVVESIVGITSSVVGLAVAL